LTFFLLVFVISIPFWLIGTLAAQFLPQKIPMGLPLSSLMAFNPLIAAFILTCRENGPDAVKTLLKRSLDYKNIKEKIWYLPILILMPVAMVLQHVLMHLTGVSISDPQIPVLMLPVFVLIFFIAALGEELGWQGYAIDRLQSRWNALEASIIVGTVGAVWHIVPLIQAHHASTWIAWQCINIVVTRIFIVWLYNNTGRSIVAAICFHAVYNISTLILPTYGLEYDPFIATIIMAGAAAVVIFLWGPETLAHYRYAR
jgi:uncharacterized protein